MKPGYKKLFIVMVALILVACVATPSQSPTSTPVSAPTILSTPTPTSVPTILPTPSTSVPLEERLLAAIDVKLPDELVFAKGFIWVKTDSGHVVQVDPATNSVVGDIKVDTTSWQHDYCQGLGTDGENIWACSTRGNENFKTIDVVRIDPSSQTVTATVEVGKIFDQYNMPFLSNHIWVLTDDGSKLVGIDTTTNQPSPAIDLGVRCFQVAATSSSLLVTCKLDDLILRVDPESMQVTERRTFTRSPWNIVATEDGAWVGLGNAVVRLDPESLNPVATFTSLPGDKGLFATKEGLWVRLDEGFLYRIDTVSNQIVEQITSDQRFYNLGSVIVTSDAIWTTAGDDDLLLRISLK